MTYRLRLVAFALAAAFQAACSGGTPNQFPVPPGGGDGGIGERGIIISVVDGPTPQGGRGGGGGAGGTGGSPAGDAGVMITVEIDSPKMGDVHPARNRFTPTVRVTLETTGVSSDNISEVTAAVNNEDTMGKGPTAKLSQSKLERTPESGKVVYHYLDTPVDVSMLPSGRYDLTVNARTTGGVMGKATVRVTIDAGPVIRIDSPGEGKFLRLSAPVDVTITDPLFPVDKSKVTMTLGQTPLMYKTGPGPDQYTATITFMDFRPPLEGDQVLTVRAANMNGTEAVVVRKFVADDQGPAITNTVPGVGILIGKVITVSAQISDPAGVLDASVKAVISHGDKTFEVQLLRTGGMAFSALFDTTKLPITVIFPHVSFRASDVLGNQSAVGYEVRLDNMPPILDLDPPAGVIIAKKDEAAPTKYRCSFPFDPVGGDSMNDLDTFTQLIDIRARIQDTGNVPLNPNEADFIPIATVASAQVLILSNVASALVVDTDNDSVCDSVNPLIRPTTTPMSSSDALLVDMAPIPPAGSADFAMSPAIPPACDGGIDMKPPNTLCHPFGTTPLTMAIEYSFGRLPAIWTIPPVETGPLCVGQQFDRLGASIKPGWICVAVRAADKLGNSQVSRPLRVCVGGMCSSPPPNCTGTQTMAAPPVVDSAKPCRPWASYPSREIRFDP